MKIIAHRNETPGCPESSIESLEYSAQRGIYAVECDVRRTGDGQYVIFHDQNLRRLARSEAVVQEITLGEMRRLMAEVGRRVITLDELIAGYRRETPILLHVKENHPWPDLIERFRASGELFIYGVQSLEMLDAVRAFTPKERTLAFMPTREMYPDFIAHGVGIIRLWEQWLDEITPDAVHAAGADQVWIMCNTPEKGMDGTPESLDRFLTLHVDGALISDVAMALRWMKEKEQVK